MRRALLLGLSYLFLAGCAGGPQAKYPIDNLQGNYTVAVYHYLDEVRQDGSVTTYAVGLANTTAGQLRRSGQEAYVADLGGEAIVAVGSYPSLETATSAAQGLAKVLGKSVGGAQVTVKGAGATGGTRTLSLEPAPVDLNALKRRVGARRAHRILLGPGAAKGAGAK
jgi:hypothetical protein